MKYKALFLDLDGTTVIHGINTFPSNKVTQAIKQCKDKNISVCLATSRPLDISFPIIEHLALSSPCVVSGGVQIYDPVNKIAIKETLMKKNVVPHIFNVARVFRKEIGIYDGSVHRRYRGGKIPDKIYGFYIRDIRKEQSEDITKELQKISGISVHRMHAWKKGYEWIDVSDSEASKLHGIVDVAKLLHIQTHEMIGVGDGYNDFPLLMACGLKVAMGNAVPELKAIADFIAPSVDEDGVATVIEKYIL